MSEGNVIRVIENQPEAAAIEIPHEVGRDRGDASSLSDEGRRADSVIARAHMQASSQSARALMASAK